jgi:hypothetical protein
MDHHQCPHCDSHNHDGENQFKAKEYISPLVKAGVVTAIAAKNRGAGVIAGGIFLAERVIHYFDGKQVTCGNCGKDYRI